MNMIVATAAASHTVNGRLPVPAGCEVPDAADGGDAFDPRQSAPAPGMTLRL